MLAELEDARTDCARVDQKQKNVKGEMEHRKNMEDVGLEDI